MSENKLDYAIVKLLKDDVVQYPITKPECIVYEPDGNGEAPTVRKKIEDLENGRRNYFNAYSNAFDEYADDKRVKLFRDEDIYAYFLVAQHESVNQKLKRILIPSLIVKEQGGSNVVWNWSRFEKSGTMQQDPYATITNFGAWFEYDGDDVADNVPTGDKHLFTMKHFVSLMNGNAPMEIKVAGTEYGSGASYTIVKKFAVETIVPNDMDNVPYLHTVTYRALVIEMAQSGAENEVVRLEIAPCIPVMEGEGYTCKAIAYNRNVVAYNLENTQN